MKWVLLLALFLIEAIANGSFLAKGSEQGLIGGLIALCLVIERRYEQPARRMISGIMKRKFGALSVRPNTQE